MKKLNCILLVDDNPADNYFHRNILNKMNIAENIHVTESGFAALEYLNNKNNILPELIFLDINMPMMNGWEFLAEYEKIERVKKAKIIVIILSIIPNHKEIEKADEMTAISDIETKPLTREAVENILEKFF